jgi:hypothetical protein
MTDQERVARLMEILKRAAETGQQGGCRALQWEPEMRLSMFDDRFVETVRLPS